MPDDSRSGDRWTITVCPECGKFQPFSAMDWIHDIHPTCGCWGLHQDDEGVIHGTFGPPLIGVEVVPAFSEWRKATESEEYRQAEQTTRQRIADAGLRPWENT